MVRASTHPTWLNLVSFPLELGHPIQYSIIARCLAHTGRGHVGSASKPRHGHACMPTAPTGYTFRNRLCDLTPTPAPQFFAPQRMPQKTPARHAQTPRKPAPNRPQHGITPSTKIPTHTQLVCPRRSTPQLGQPDRQPDQQEADRETDHKREHVPWLGLLYLQAACRHQPAVVET